MGDKIRLDTFLEEEEETIYDTIKREEGPGATRYRRGNEDYDTIGHGHYLDNEEAYIKQTQRLGILDPWNLDDISQDVLLKDDVDIRKEGLSKKYPTASQGILDIMINPKMQYGDKGFEKYFGADLRSGNVKGLKASLERIGKAFEKRGDGGVKTRYERVIKQLDNYTKDIQKHLKRKGKNPGKIDGIFGDKTRDATIEYQKEKGLKPDGKVGRNTWSDLISMFDRLTGVSDASAGEVMRLSDFMAEEKTKPRKKGQGFLGTLQRPDGGISTELSIGVNFDGQEREIPTLVPTLTEQEKNFLINGNAPSEEIVTKAVNHARERISQGKSPFAQESEGLEEKPQKPMRLSDFMGEEPMRLDSVMDKPKEEADENRIGELTKKFVEEAFQQPWHSFNSSVQQGFANTLRPIAGAYDFYADKLKMGDPDAKRWLERTTEEYDKLAWQEREKGILPIGFSGKLAKGVYEALGGAFIEIPKYMAGSAALAPVGLGFAGMGAVGFMEATPEGTQEAVGAGIQGLAFQQYVKAISLLPRSIQLPSAFSTFAGSTHLNGGTPEESLASGILGVGLSLTGRAPSMKEFRSRYAKNPHALENILKNSRRMMKAKSIWDYRAWKKDATKVLDKYGKTKVLESEVQQILAKSRGGKVGKGEVKDAVNRIRNVWAKQVSDANARKSGGLKLLTPQEMLGEGVKLSKTLETIKTKQAVEQKAPQREADYALREGLITKKEVKEAYKKSERVKDQIKESKKVFAEESNVKIDKAVKSGVYSGLTMEEFKEVKKREKEDLWEEERDQRPEKYVEEKVEVKEEIKPEKVLEKPVKAVKDVSELDPKDYKSAEEFVNDYPRGMGSGEGGRQARAMNFQKNDRVLDRIDAVSKTNPQFDKGIPKEVTIYRGGKGGKIKPGDFVTLSEGIAKQYGESISKTKVLLKDLVIGGNTQEFIYAPESMETTPTDIWNKAQEKEKMPKKSKGHIIFDDKGTEWVEKNGKIYRVSSDKAIDTTGKNKGYRFGLRFEYPNHMAVKVKENLLKEGIPVSKQPKQDMIKKAREKAEENKEERYKKVLEDQKRIIEKQISFKENYGGKATKKEKDSLKYIDSELEKRKEEEPKKDIVTKAREKAIEKKVPITGVEKVSKETLDEFIKEGETKGGTAQSISVDDKILLNTPKGVFKGHVINKEPERQIVKIKWLEGDVKGESFSMSYNDFNKNIKGKREDKKESRIPKLVDGFIKALNTRTLPNKPKELRALAEKLVGGDSKEYYDEIYDSLEIALNKTAFIDKDDIKKGFEFAQIEEDRLPLRQRSLETIKRQQFSTPLTLATAANYALDVQEGDIVLEPTAGTGNLIIPFQKEGVKYIANELDERRQEVLRTQKDLIVTNQDFLKYSGENPTVIIANPPFGALSKGKYVSFVADFKPSNIDQRFIAKMLRILPNGGRIAVITSEGTGDGTSGASFRKWLKDNHTFIANIKSPPGAYKKRGSPTIGTHLLVIEKGQELGTPRKTIYGVPRDFTDYAMFLEEVRKHNPRLTVKPIKSILKVKEGDKDVSISTVKSPTGQPSRKSEGTLAPTSEPGRSGESIDKSRDRPTPISTEQQASRTGVEDDVGQGSTSRGTEVSGKPTGKRAGGKRIGSFVEYQRHNTLKGIDSKHPSIIVESQELASVPPPKITYKPTAKLLQSYKEGNISNEQMDVALMALQSMDKGKGYLIADDVGVGKTREMAAIILDALDSGKANRVLYVSLNQNVLDGHIDGDFSAVMTGKEGNPLPFETVRLESFPNLSSQENLPVLNKSIYTITQPGFRQHYDRVLELGFDLIVFDEAHKWQQDSNKTPTAIAWNKIHDAMQGKPMIYATATPGIDLDDLQYLYGLGEWNKNTFDIYMSTITGKEPQKKGMFVSKSAFSSGASIPLTQQFMRELKMKGLYSSRDLSRENVEFTSDKVDFTEEDIIEYDKYIAFLLKAHKTALKYVKENKSKKGKKGIGIIKAMMQNAAKRYQVDLKAKKIIPEIEKTIAAGERVVVMTGGLNKLNPDAPMGYIRAVINAINEDKVDVIEGETFEEKIPEAIEEKMLLLEELEENFPEQLSIEDYLTEQLGKKYKIGYYTGNTTNSRRKKYLKEWSEGKLDIMIGSNASKTAISLHDTIGKRIKTEYLDVDFEITMFKQALGRTNRAGEVTSPKINIPNIGAAGEQKFIGTAAVRMKGLGAVGKGQAESTATDFLSKYDLEGTIAHQAARSVFNNINNYDKELFTNKQLYEMGNEGDLRVKRTAPNTFTIDNFLYDLNFMPYHDGNRMLDKLLISYENIIEQSSETAALRAERLKGKKLKEMRLFQDPEVDNDFIDLHEVVDESGHKFGVVTGMINEKAALLAKYGMKNFVKFTTPEELISGKKVLPSYIPALAKEFGKDIASSITKENVFETIMAGDKVTLANDLELYLRQNKKAIGIRNAKMKDKNILVKAGARFMPVGSQWVIPEVKKSLVMEFLKSFPLSIPSKLKGEKGSLELPSLPKFKWERKERKGPTDLEQMFEDQLDIWFKEKDGRIHDAKVENRILQKELKRLLGEKYYSEKVQMYDKAIQIYIDSKNDPKHVKKYYNLLSKEQKKIVDISQDLPENVQSLADVISERYKEIGLEARDEAVIMNVLDNYVARVWKDTELFRKFGTKTRHGKKRKLKTIIEGWANKLELQVEGATNNLSILKQEIIKTIEDKRFVNGLRALKNEEGNPMLSTKHLSKGDRMGKDTVITEDYDLVEHPNFTVWEWAGKMEEGKAYGKDFFATDEGVLFEKRELYAPSSIAYDMNKILGISNLKKFKSKEAQFIVDKITKYNAIIKSWVLQSSLFHHFAFARSYMLGVQGKKWNEMNPFTAYKKGMQMVEAGDPIVRFLVENGLTLGIKQDWSEELLQEKTAIGELLDKWHVSKSVKDTIMTLRNRHTEFLFNELGSGLKVMAATIEYRNQVKEYPNENKDVIAKRVAGLINDDFGGLHLGRLKRDPTVQHFFRMFCLAADWTESNIRTMVIALGGRGKGNRGVNGKRRAKLYQRFWAGVLLKGIFYTVLLNLMMATMDEDDDEAKGLLQRFMRNYRNAWGVDKDGNLITKVSGRQPWKRLLWTAVDITPIYKATGGKKDVRKYFSVLGHFMDVLKFAIDPLRSAHHKSSIISGMIFESLSGEDWAGRSFTTVDELLGVDDKGIYQKTVKPHKKGDPVYNEKGYYTGKEYKTTVTEEKAYKKGDPKGGKDKGKLVKWNFGGGKPVSYETIPSYTLSQVKGSQPVQLQNFIAWHIGEMEAFDAILNSAGVGVKTTYEK